MSGFLGFSKIKIKKGVFGGQKRPAKSFFFLFGLKGGHVDNENISSECKNCLCLCIYLCAGTMLQGIWIGFNLSCKDSLLEINSMPTAG